MPGSTVAPGRQGATRGTSSRKAQASSIEAGTVKSFSSFMWLPSPLLRLEPILADAGVDLERRVDVRRRDHLASDDLLRPLHLLGRTLEQQLVVDLQDAARLQAGGRERVRAAHH